MRLCLQIRKELKHMAKTPLNKSLNANKDRHFTSELKKVRAYLPNLKYPKRAIYLPETKKVYILAYSTSKRKGDTQR